MSNESPNNQANREGKKKPKARRPGSIDFPDSVREILAQLQREWFVESIWFIGSRANDCAKPDSDWDFLVFTSVEPEVAPRRHPAVDIVRIGPSGRGLAEGFHNEILFQDWEWSRKDEVTASYIGRKYIEYPGGIRDCSDPVGHRVEQSAYLIWSRNEKKPKTRRIGQRTELEKGKHLIRVFLGKDSSTGKRHYHSEIFLGGARQAEDWIRELIRRHKVGEPLKAGSDTLGSFLDEWIEAKRLSVEESSLVTYQGAVNNHIRPSIGNLLLTRVTADDIQRMYGKLREKDKLDMVMIRYVHKILGMIFKLAVKRKKLNGSPMAGVEIPKEITQDDDDNQVGDDRAMTSDQVKLFLNAASGNRFENLFKLAFHIGCRPGELLALKWKDLDPAARTLRINQSIVWRKGGDWYLKKPKTKLSRRTLPLTATQIEILNEQRRRQLEARMKVGKLWRNWDFIFCNEVGDPYPQWTLHKDCKLILRTAGLPSTFSPYTTRHTMATLLIAGGTNVKAVSERLGHSKVTITLQEYTHVSKGMQADVSEEIERLLGGKK